MGDDKGRKAEEERLRQERETDRLAAEKKLEAAAVPDPLETRRRDYITSVDDWRMGKSGPIDVRNMPGGGVGMSLFNDAKRSRDAGRIGRGLATISAGANPNFAAALDKETQLERDLAASGALENDVNDRLGDVDAEMLGLANVGNTRAMRLADMAQSVYGRADDAYTKLRDKPKPPSFLKQFALGLASNASYSKGAFAI